MAQAVADAPALSVPDLAHALAVSRSRFEHRAVIVAADSDELRAGLDALLV
ncbi:hypothetical protein, partial [Streptomyces sp. NRRL WC-3549]|uniref:CurL C-terminal domain-containing protein n=1 Tax=Streptomyces sp. NRRL WC-3549 TaxID=1463925 RepID=UPI003B63A788